MEVEPRVKLDVADRQNFLVNTGGTYSVPISCSRALSFQAYIILAATGKQTNKQTNKQLQKDSPEYLVAGMDK